MRLIPWGVLIFGAIAGVAAAFSPGGVFIALLAAATCAAVYRFAAREERGFLIRLFVVAFVVRIALSVALDLGSWRAEGHPSFYQGPPEYWNVGVVDKSRDYLRMGDSDTYSQRAYCLAQYAQGNREAVVLRRIQMYGYHAYVVVMGWFYYLFGFSPVTVKWLNGWIGSLHVLAIFYLAKACFQLGIARWAGLLTALFPTLALWSATNLKEPLFSLLTALLFLLFASLRSSIGLKRWALYGAASFGLFQLFQDLGRKEVGWSLAAGLVAALLLEKLLRRRWIPLILLLLVIGGIALKPWPIVKQAIHLGIYRHMGYAYAESASYRYLPDKFYTPSSPLRTGGLSDADVLSVIKRIPLALMHYFLQPFPGWAGRFSLLLLPQVVLWYFMLCFAVIGAVVGARWSGWNCGFLLLMGMVWSFMGALSNGNIGTLIRLRDMLTPIVILFAAGGLWACVRGSQGFPKVVARV